MKCFDLVWECDHYYIKRSKIVGKIAFHGRTFFPRYERINAPFTSLLWQQHLDKEYTIALPLLKDGKTDYIVIEYEGGEHARFYHLVKYLFGIHNITDYHIYQGKDPKQIQVFIKVPSLPLDVAHAKLEALSQALEQQMTKEWKCLPSMHLPQAYNIVTLPYQRI